MNAEEFIKNESLKESIAKVKTIDELAALLQNHGLDISQAELEAAFSQNQAEEINEAALDSIAGGRLAWLLPILLSPSFPVFPWMKKQT